MKSIRVIFLLLFLTLTFLWLLADNLLLIPYGFFSLRKSQVNLTGVLAIGAMSVGMILALRPFHIEPFLGGMDKSYRLHKWLGIAALVVAIIHWLWAVVPKWLVGWGLLIKLAKTPASAQSTVMEWLSGQRSQAEQLGEWAFYIAIVLILIALIKQFPYRYFFKTHRFLAPIYLVLVYHSVVLMKATYWSTALGMVMALLMIGGSIAAVLSMLGGIGRKMRAVGVIDALEYFHENRVLNVAIQLRDRWAPHQAGQFAFVTFDSQEGAHPFTVSSSWNHLGKLNFHIKELGDYTCRLSQALKPGQVVTVEGPYGRFDFSGSHSRQIWVGGGIGITPFMARLQALTVQPDGRQIDLWYCTAEPAQPFIDSLTPLAAQAGVRLHILVSGRDSRLTTERLCAEVPDWQAASIWFCGPADFGNALRKGLTERGLNNNSFHQELFEMR